MRCFSIVCVLLTASLAAADKPVAKDPATWTLDECLATGAKAPTGKPSKKVKFEGAWSCIITGEGRAEKNGPVVNHDGKAKLIFMPGDGATVEVTSKVTDNGTRNFTDKTERHGEGLLSQTDTSRNVYELRGGIVKKTQVYFEKLNESTNMCTKLVYVCNPIK